MTLFFPSSGRVFCNQHPYTEEILLKSSKQSIKYENICHWNHCLGVHGSVRQLVNSFLNTRTPTNYHVNTLRTPKTTIMHASFEVEQLRKIGKNAGRLLSSVYVGKPFCALSEECVHMWEQLHCFMTLHIR